MAVYLTFATNSAAFEASMIALTGTEALQWMKVCNRYTRFCIQIGGALLCGFLASILMALISTASAYKLFRMYSPKSFLRLKGKWSFTFQSIYTCLYRVKFATGKPKLKKMKHCEEKDRAWVAIDKYRSLRLLLMPM